MDRVPASSTSNRHQRKNFRRKRNQRCKDYKRVYEAVCGNVYTYAPIIRRRLIEKYSTARYNFNTKFMMKKGSCLGKRRRLKKSEKGSSMESGDHQPQTRETSTKQETRDSHILEKTSALPGEENSVEYDENKPCCNYTQKQGCKIWKIAPNNFYQCLWEKCKCNVEFKINRVKKRKRKGYRRKVAHSITPKVYYSDPYLECMNNLSSACKSGEGKNDEHLGIVMYVGVHRPLFPLIYRNIRLLNGNRDTYVTEFWAEFALSTLIVNREDTICKPVLIPVKDPELRFLIVEYGAPSLAYHDTKNEMKCGSSDGKKIKKTCTLFENNDFADSNLRSYDARKTKAKVCCKIESGSDHEDSSAITNALPGMRDSELDEQKVLKEFGYKECVVAIPKLNSTQILALPHDEIYETYRKSVDFGRNERIEEKCCKDDAFKKNTCSDVSEKENEELHYFGLHCTRTHSTMIDYALRNRTTVYLYKIQKMLDFQKTNNKYFTCCDYILMEYDETNDSVDILRSQTVENQVPDDEENEPPSNDVNEHAARCKRSKNPNDIFKLSKISEWRENSARITSVKIHCFKSTAVPLKWLSLKFDDSVISVCYAQKLSLRHRLLFEVMYRAELSKKVIYCPIDRRKSVDSSLEFGVYSFPGICDFVFIGPYSFHEEHELTTMMRLNDGNVRHISVKTLEEEEEESYSLQQNVGVNRILAKWWWPKKPTTDWNDLNERHLQFLFGPHSAHPPAKIEKLDLKKLLREHDCLNFHSYSIGGTEHNFVLFHDFTNTLRNVEQADAATNDNTRRAAKKEWNNIVEPRPNNSRIRRKPTVDQFSYRKRRCTEKSKSRRCYPSKYTPKNDQFFSTLRSRAREPNHLDRERKRRLEFRNFKNHLEFILNGDQSSPELSAVVSLNSTLQRSVEMIKWLETDTQRLVKEGKSLRKKQMILMKLYSTLLESLDSKSSLFKKGVQFVARLKDLKKDCRNKLSSDLRTECASSEIDYRALLADIDQDKMSPIFSKFLQKHHSPSGAMRNEFTFAKETELNAKSHETNCKTKRRAKLKSKKLKTRKTLRIPAALSKSVNETKTSVKIPAEKSNLNTAAKRHRITNSTYPGGEITESDPLEDDNVHHSNRNEETALRKRRSHTLDVGTVNILTGFRENSSTSTSMYTPYMDHSYCKMDGDGNSHLCCTWSSVLELEDSTTEKRKTNLKTTKISSSRNEKSKLPSIRSRVVRNFAKTKANESVMCSRNSRDDGEEDVNLEDTQPDGKITSKHEMTAQQPNFQAVIRERSCNQFSIDITENQQVFARLNIARIHDRTRDEASSTVALDDNTKILTLIRRILARIHPTSDAANCADEQKPNEKRTLAKKTLLIRKLRSLIDHMEFERKRVSTHENGASVEVSEDGQNGTYKTSAIRFDEDIENSSNSSSIITEKGTDSDTFDEVRYFDGDGSRVSRRSFEIANIENVLIDEDVEDVPSIGDGDVEKSKIASFNFNEPKDTPIASGGTRFKPIRSKINADSFATVHSANELFDSETVAPKIQNTILLDDHRSDEARASKLTCVEIADADDAEPSRSVSNDWRCERVSRLIGSVIDEGSPSLNSAIIDESNINAIYHKDDSNRICVKPFACAGKFDLVFPSNIDKLLSPS